MCARDEAPQLCYVCHEPCTEQSLCNCAAYVHPLCLLKSAIACGTERCTICRTSITNLTLLRTRQRSRVDTVPQRGELIVLLICSLFFSTLSLLFFAASTERLEQYAHLYAMCCAVTLALAGSASRAFSRRADPIYTLNTESSIALLQ